MIIDLKNISVSFDGEPILKNLNLYIRDKEFITLLGPSGCGKTTTLRIIGGFLEPDEGTVIFDGKKINGVPPHKRQVNTIFQRYALFPHLDVYENIAFGLRVKKWPEKKIRDKVNEMLALVNLKGFKRRKIASLSGGQQQRVAIARALANEPRVLLLDEPLGALDLKLRKDMQVELKNIQQRMGITFIYVTHDQEEALSMSDTVVVMDSGVIQQIGTPEEVFNHPANLFVAGFIGMPQMNLFDARLERRADGVYEVLLENARIQLSEEKQARLEANGVQSQAIKLGVRPEHIMLAGEGSQMIHGTVDVSEMMGSAVHLHLQACGRDTIIIIQTMDMQGPNRVDFSVGQRIAFTFGGNIVHVFDPESGKNLEQ